MSFRIGKKVWWYDYEQDEIKFGWLFYEEEKYFAISTKEGIYHVYCKAVFFSKKEILEYANEYYQQQIKNLNRKISANKKKIGSRELCKFQ